MLIARKRSNSRKREEQSTHEHVLRNVGHSNQRCSIVLRRNEGGDRGHMQSTGLLDFWLLDFFLVAQRRLLFCMNTCDASNTADAGLLTGSYLRTCVTMWARPWVPHACHTTAGHIVCGNNFVILYNSHHSDYVRRNDTTMICLQELKQHDNMIRSSPVCKEGKRLQQPQEPQGTSKALPRAPSHSTSKVLRAS